jgi:deoxycytidylate deaminase
MNTEIFNETFKLAQAVIPVRGARIAASVVRKGKVVSYGYNHKKSHPFQARFCKNKDAVFFHAEVHAIKNALQIIDVDDLSKCELYIVRAKRDKNNKRWITGLSKPCSGCQKCIDLFELKNIYYSEEKEIQNETY